MYPTGGGLERKRYPGSTPRVVAQPKSVGISIGCFPVVNGVASTLDFYGFERHKTCTRVFYRILARRRNWKRISADVGTVMRRHQARVKRDGDDDFCGQDKSEIQELVRPFGTTGRQIWKNNCRLRRWLLSRSLAPTSDDGSRSANIENTWCPSRVLKPERSDFRNVGRSPDLLCPDSRSVLFWQGCRAENTEERVSFGSLEFSKPLHGFGWRSKNFEEFRKFSLRYGETNVHGHPSIANISKISPYK